jgi:hypothetical protein
MIENEVVRGVSSPNRMQQGITRWASHKLAASDSHPVNSRRPASWVSTTASPPRLIRFPQLTPIGRQVWGVAQKLGQTMPDMLVTRLRVPRRDHSMSLKGKRGSPNSLRQSDSTLGSRGCWRCLRQVGSRARLVLTAFAPFRLLWILDKLKAVSLDVPLPNVLL